MDSLQLSKIKKLQHYFPDFADEICAEILESINWEVEDAVAALGGRPTLNLSSDQELTEWPKLSETVKQEKARNGRRVSGGSTEEKAVLNRQRSLGSSPSPRSSPFERLYYKKNEEANNLPLFQGVSALPNGRESNPAVDSSWEPVMRQFPNKSNHDALRQALRAELAIPEQRKLLVSVAYQHGKVTPKILVLMRGVPGSGKSRLSSLIVGVSDSGVHVSADDYFINQYGKYCFSPQNLGAAHEQARQKCLKSMEINATPIVIDNTNTEAWEMIPYVKLAIQYGYEIVLAEPSTIWKKNASILATKTVHSVPKQKISEMLRRFQHDVTVPKLIELASKDNNKSVNHPRNKSGKRTSSLPPPRFVKSSVSSVPGLSASGYSKASFSDSESRENFSAPVLNGADWAPPRRQSALTRFEEAEAAGLPELTTRLLHRDDHNSAQSYLADEDEDAKLWRDVKEIGGIDMFSNRNAEQNLPPLHQYDPSPCLASLSSPIKIEGDGLWSSPENSLRPDSDLSLAEIEEDALHRRMQEDVDRLLFDEGPPESLTESIDDESPSSSSDPSGIDYAAADLDLNIIKNIFDESEIRSFSRSEDSRPYSEDSHRHEQSRQDKVDALHNLFPECPGATLDELFISSKGDFEWCTTLLEMSYTKNDNHNGERRSGLNFSENRDVFSTRVPPLAAGSSNSRSANEIFQRCNTNGTPEYPSVPKSSENKAPPPFHGFQSLVQNPGPSSQMNGPTSSSFGDGARGAAAPAREINTKEDLVSDLFVPIDGEDWFDLDLGPDFVNTLMKTYSNPFGLSDAHNLPKDYLKIRIPPKMAFKMFQYFALNVSQKTSLTESIEQTRSSVEAETEQLIDDLMSMDLLTSSTSPDFEKLMELEMRLNAQDQKYIDLKRREIQVTMATKLTLGKLQAAFPSLKEEKIKDVYAQNNGKYAETLRALQTMHGDKFKQECLTDNFLEASRIIQSSVQQEVQTLQESASFSEEAGKDEELTAQEWRTRATQHHFLRMEYRRKVNETHRHGIGVGVSSYYSKLANMHQTKMIEANKRAAQLIIEDLYRKHGDGNILDLHHLFLNEATQVLTMYLRDKMAYVESTNRKLEIRVIVGKGLNSHNNNARLAPHVVDFLKRHHYSFVILPGVLVVTLTPSKDSSRTLRF